MRCSTKSLASWNTPSWADTAQEVFPSTYRVPSRVVCRPPDGASDDVGAAVSLRSAEGASPKEGKEGLSDGKRVSPG